MNRKLFSQMKNEWKSNVGLAVELLIISVVLWYIADFMYGVLVYRVEPNGIDIGHVYRLNVDNLPESHPRFKPGSKNADELRELLARLRRHPGIEAAAISRSGSAPYSSNGSWSDATMIMAEGDTADLGVVGDLSIRIATVTPEFARVFRLRGTRGETPAQIAQIIARGEAVAGVNLYSSIDSAHAGETPDILIGKHLLRFREDGNHSHIKLGALIDDVKRGDYEPLYTSGYLVWPMSESDDDEMENYNEISIRVTEAADGAGFVENFRNSMATEFTVGNLYVKDIVPYSSLRDSYQADADKMMVRLSLVMGFLLINVFLGLFGTFWFRTRRRTAEIAVRKINGATRWAIFRRLVSEGMLLLLIVTPVAVLIDWLLRYNSLTVGSEYDYFSYGRLGFCIAAVFLLMALMIVAGTFFPARAAMNIDPATALHDE